MSLRRFSEVHDAAKLHNQLNRLVDDQNQTTTAHQALLDTHALQIAATAKQIADLKAQIAALQTLVNNNG